MKYLDVAHAKHTISLAPEEYLEDIEEAVKTRRKEIEEDKKEYPPGKWEEVKAQIPLAIEATIRRMSGLPKNNCEDKEVK